jgi:hypothetical protein
MAIHFAKSTLGFYDDAVHSKLQIPTDAVSISAAQYQALLAAQSSGQVIQADANGNPVAAVFVPSAEQTAARLKADAQTALDASDVTVLRCIEHDIVLPSEWVTYRTSLRAVVNGTSSTIPTRPAYPAGS